MVELISGLSSASCPSADNNEGLVLPRKSLNLDELRSRTEAGLEVTEAAVTVGSAGARSVRGLLLAVADSFDVSIVTSGRASPPPKDERRGLAENSANFEAAGGPVGTGAGTGSGETIGSAETATELRPESVTVGPDSSAVSGDSREGLVLPTKSVNLDELRSRTEAGLDVMAAVIGVSTGDATGSIAAATAVAGGGDETVLVTFEAAGATAATCGL